MSNQILYDPPLVRGLAAELDQRLRGRACAAAPLFLSGRVAVLPLDRGEALRLDLHPSRGWIRVVPWEAAGDELDGQCDGVHAPPDERLLEVEIRATERFRVSVRRLVVELHTNQWNALLVAADDRRILSVLHARAAGGRSLRAGAEYVPPPAQRRYSPGEHEREEAWQRWRGELGDLPAERRRAALLDGFAAVGSASADAVLGAAAGGGEAELREAFGRWWALLHPRGGAPVLLRARGRLLPYPVGLPGVEAEPVGSLLEAMDRVAARDPEPEVDPGDAQRWAQVQRARAAAVRRLERLEAELAAAEDPDRYRGWGDLLLANFHRIGRGAAEVELDGWDGEPVRIPLDPALSPAENAARWYDEARRRERAAERLPGLLAGARAEVDRWDALLEAGPGSELPAWAARELERRPAADPAGDADAAGGPPYRTYRTAGGLEVRVGRSARANDRLTFGNSSPDDIWLHARSVPGSHVVLRWPDAEGAPPARDLQEAAALAAFHSRARSSALVPVDWTRRKYVRKPRGAPPGSVVLLRAKTLFVEPDPALEERLREQ